MALLCKLISMPIVYFTAIVLARFYGSEKMGTYFLAFQIVSILSILCSLGLDLGLVRFFAIFKDDGNHAGLRLFWPALALVSGLSCLAALGMYNCADWMALRFHAPGLSLIMVYAALTLPITVATYMCREALRALGGVRWVVLQGMIFTPALILASMVILAYYGQNLLNNVKALGLSLFLGTLLGLILLTVALVNYWRTFPIKKQASQSHTSFRNLLSYSWPILFSAFVGILFGSLDSLLLGFFTNPKQVAYYEAANRVTLVVSFSLLAVNHVVPPLIARFYQKKDLLGLENLAQTTARWTCCVGLPCSLVIILLAPDILAIFGPDFLQARIAITCLALCELVNVATGSVDYIMIMTGNQWIRTFTLIGVATISVPLMAYGAATYGLNGVVVARVFGRVGLNLLLCWIIWRHLKIKIYANAMERPFMAGLLAMIMFFLSKPLVGPWGGAIFFGLAYLALMGKSLRREFHMILH